MPITARQTYDLLLADRTRDPALVAAMVQEVLADNPTATLLDCEMAFRDAAAHSYVVADVEGYRIVIGVQAQRAALQATGIEAQDHASLLRSSRMGTRQASGTT